MANNSSTALLTVKYDFTSGKVMPIRQVMTNEYECDKCGYKWVSRTNGEDGPIPSRCAKCKRLTWRGNNEPDFTNSKADFTNSKADFTNSKANNELQALLETANARITELEEIETKRIAESGFQNASSMQPRQQHDNNQIIAEFAADRLGKFFIASKDVKNAMYIKIINNIVESWQVDKQNG